MSYASREGVLTRTPDWNVASSKTTGPATVRRTDSSSGVRSVRGVIAPFVPTNSARAQTAWALSTAVEFASCTTNQSRDAPEISTSNEAGAVRDWGGVPARPPRELIGVTNRAVGGAGSSPSIFRAPRSNQFASRAPLTNSSACSVVATVLRVEKTWSRMGRPSARASGLAGVCHSRVYRPGGGPATAAVPPPGWFCAGG